MKLGKISIRTKCPIFHDTFQCAKVLFSRPSYLRLLPAAPKILLPGPLLLVSGLQVLQLGPQLLAHSLLCLQL